MINLLIQRKFNLSRISLALTLAELTFEGLNRNTCCGFVLSPLTNDSLVWDTGTLIAGSLILLIKSNRCISIDSVLTYS